MKMFKAGYCFCVPGIDSQYRILNEVKVTFL